MTDRQKPTSEDYTQEVWAPALKEAGLAFVAATLLLTTFYIFAFKWIHPEFVPFMGREATKLIAPGKDFIPVSTGGYRVDGDSTIIENFNGDEAILVLTRSFEAEDYPFIKVNIEGLTRFSRFKILWRLTEDLSQTYALEFNRSSDHATQIAMVYAGESYRGQVSDLALFFYDGPSLGFENNNNIDIAIKSIELRPFSPEQVAEQIFEDWSNPPIFQGNSNNIVLGIHAQGMLYPNAVANLLVVIGFVLAFMWRIRNIRQKSSRKAHGLLLTALCLCLYGWVFNDALRWYWRIEQLVDTHERYAGLPLNYRVRNNDARCTRFPVDCKADLLPYF